MRVNFQWFYKRNPLFLGILNDLVLYGGSQFALHVINLENKVQQKSAIELIGSQFISFKDFNEKLTTIFKEFINMSSCENIQELMHYLSKTMPIIFNAEKVLLWSIDAVIFSYFHCNFMVFWVSY